MNKKIYAYSSLAAVIFIVDRITKMVALAWYAQSARIVNHYLSFEVVFNRGISWGMFHSTGDAIFMFVSLVQVTITAMLCWYVYHQYGRAVSVLGAVCIIAGSVSNLIDRVMYGGVVDFILLSWGNYSWPVFNVADAAIVCGVFVMVFLDEK